MLKLTLSVKKNLDVFKFNWLQAFLKRKNDGYQPRRSLIFSNKDIDKFLSQAPEGIYVIMKLVAIKGVAEACRINELHRMLFKDLEFQVDLVLVKILETKKEESLSLQETMSLQ